jgi:hypothetical protein
MRILCDYHPDQPGYWESLDWVVAQGATRGLRTQLTAGADWQPLDQETRRQRVTALVARYGQDPRVLLRVANEPRGNGWSGDLDPAYLDLCRWTRSLLGHGDFLVGDPADGDDPDASKGTVQALATLAGYANLVALHPSRNKGAANDGDRMRRHVDHAEGTADALPDMRRVNPNAVLVLDEMMGNASVRWVPIPGRAPYEREYVEGCAVAGQVTAFFATGSANYHYIAEQDAGTPGLAASGDLLAQFPYGPGWRYLNDTWGGSATHGFDGWSKVRTYTDGTTAYVLAEGRRRGNITWVTFDPLTREVLYDYSRHVDGDDCEVQVFRLTR